MKDFDINKLDLDRHVSIEASAGTGKTHTIQKIVRKILKDSFENHRGIGVENILLVTYTEAAAGELKRRIRKELLSAAKDEEQYCRDFAEFLRGEVTRLDNANIQTIHAFCKSVLDRFPFESAMPLKGKDADENVAVDAYEAEWRKRLAEIANDSGDVDFAQQIQTNDALRKAFHQIPQWAKLYNVKTDEFDVDADSWAGSGKTDLKAHYQRLAREIKDLKSRVLEREARAGEVGFDEMIRRVREAVEAEASPLLPVLRKKFKYAIIDEFQDTNADQWAIFSKIFLESCECGGKNILMIIGDPKQSIYRFQGADVGTYSLAKKEIEMKKGQMLSLPCNFRSSEKILDEMKSFFESELFSAWPESSNAFSRDIWKNIGTTPGRDAQKKVDKIPGAAGLYFWDCRGDEKDEEKAHVAQSIGKQRADYYQRICDWIDRNCRDEKTLPFLDTKGDSDRWLGVGDCAILVNSNAEGEKVINRLRRRGIPCTYYKRKKLFQSDFAVEWIALLQAIDDLGRNLEKLVLVLMGHFFGYSENELIGFSRENDARDAIALFEKTLKPLAEKGRWGEMFGQLWLRTDFVHRMRALDFAGEEVLSAFNQFREDSLRHLEKSSGGLRSEILRLKALNANDAETELDQNLFAKATEEECVRVMTIHASKGLEFPVVFCLPSGSLNPKESRHFLLHDGEDARRRKLLLASSNKSEDYKDRETQEYEELLRLLYVAITRAKQLCFVPILEGGTSNKTKAFWEKIAEYAESVPAENEMDHSGNEMPRLQTGGEESECTRGADRPAPMEKFDVPKESKDHFGRLVIGAQQTSYSDLIRKHSSPNDDDKPPYIDKDRKLPRGNTFGDAVHKIFEKGDWSVLAGDENGAALPFVRSVLSSHGLLNVKAKEDRDNRCKATLDLVRKTLNAEVPLSGGGKMALKDLDAGYRSQETEFFFSVSENGEIFKKTSDIQNYVKGEIDLLYSYTDKGGNWRIGILDWKTNSLREGDSLEETMRENGYEIQAALYTAALDQFLRTRVSGYAPENNLAKPIYVFVRACGTENCNGGIWTPSEENWRGDRANWGKWAKTQDGKEVDLKNLLGETFGSFGTANAQEE